MDGVHYQVQRIENEPPGDFRKISHIIKGEMYRKSFQDTGDTQDSVWSVGVTMGFIDDIPTCAELIEGIIDEAEGIMKQRLPTMICEG